MSFTAKYDGTCAECGGEIRKGERLEWIEDRQVVHAGCTPEAELAANGNRVLLKQRETCPRCWTVKAANDACACDPEDVA